MTDPSNPSPETHLPTLLATLEPRLDDRTFVFCTLPGARDLSDVDPHDLATLCPVVTAIETEGLTVVVEPHRAEAAGLPYDGRFARITLEVRSSLQAVGLTAAVAGRLTEHGISANVVAAFHHDHVFVPEERAEEALTALRELARESADR